MNEQKDSLIIRSIDTRDIENLYDLLNSLSEQAKHYFHPHPFDKKTITKICSSKEDYYFVMILNKNLIGYSMLRLFGYKIPSFGCCIHNSYEGKGYGTILTKWTLDKAKKLGFSKVILKVYMDNNKALKMYEKIGFKIKKKDTNTNEIKMFIYI